MLMCHILFLSFVPFRCSDDRVGGGPQDTLEDWKGYMLKEVQGQDRRGESPVSQTPSGRYAAELATTAREAEL